MAPSSPSDAGDGGERLKRCIRDLAALTALPSLCVGRTPEETLDILIDALPTALSCDLVYFDVPGPTPQQRASLGGAPLSPDALEQIRSITTSDDDGADAEIVVAGTKLW